MNPILATVLKGDKLGNEFVVTVQLGNEDFSGPFAKLNFENKPDQGWYHYGWLDLIYHRDPDLRAGQVFHCGRLQQPNESLPNLPRTCSYGRFTYPFQMTIGELREELEDWPEGDEIIFGCEELEFSIGFAVNQLRSKGLNTKKTLYGVALFASDFFWQTRGDFELFHYIRPHLEPL
jgi:hypothetical protein